MYFTLYTFTLIIRSHHTYNRYIYLFQLYIYLVVYMFYYIIFYYYITLINYIYIYISLAGRATDLLVPCIFEGRSELRNVSRVNCKTQWLIFLQSCGTPYLLNELVTQQISLCWILQCAWLSVRSIPFFIYNIYYILFIIIILLFNNKYILQPTHSYKG